MNECGQYIELAIGAPDVNASDDDGKNNHEQSDRYAPGHDAGTEFCTQQFFVEGNERDETVIHDPWLLNILNNQELHDKAVNKQLMEAKIRQHGGKNGQNCW